MNVLLERWICVTSTSRHYKNTFLNVIIIIQLHANCVNNNNWPNQYVDVISSCIECWFWKIKSLLGHPFLWMGVNLSCQAHHCNLPQCGFHYQPIFVAKKVVVKDIQYYLDLNCNAALNIQIKLCGSSIPCEADHVIKECFTGKMNLPNFHLPSPQEHIHECYKSTRFMHNWTLHELLHCTCRCVWCMYNCFKMLVHTSTLNTSYFFFDCLILFCRNLIFFLTIFLQKWLDLPKFRHLDQILKNMDA